MNAAESIIKDVSDPFPPPIKVGCVVKISELSLSGRRRIWEDWKWPQAKIEEILRSLRATRLRVQRIDGDHCRLHCLSESCSDKVLYDVVRIDPFGASVGEAEQICSWEVTRVEETSDER